MARDQFVFVLFEDVAPLGLRFEVDEVFGVEETGGVGAVVGAPGLTDDLGHLGKGGEDKARLVHDAQALRGTGAGSECAADPDGAFVEMGEKLRADDAAEAQEQS